MIRVENLSKRYGETQAVEDVSFQVAKGEVVGFLGPNGAGKTTTMRILACYIPASSGSVSIDGFDAFENSLEVRSRIGYLPETPPLYPEMTVRSFLQFCARLRGVPHSEEGHRLGFVLERCGLEDVSRRLVGNLSKGYRQRVGLAQALIHDPPVLILDEPTVGLDPRQIREIRQLIEELGQDRTVILSTHILPEVQALCRRVIIISRGRIAATDTVERLQQDVGGDAIRVRVAGNPREAAALLHGHPNVREVTLEADEILVVPEPEVEELRPGLVRALVEGNQEVLEISQARMGLEEVFVRVTAQDPGAREEKT